MKKVRLALGTIGLAPVLTGMTMAPAAHAAATGTTHTAYGHAAAVTPDWKNCTFYGNGVGAHASGAGPIEGFIYHSGSCVWSQGLILGHSQDGLTERVRFRSRNNAILRSTWQEGHQSAGETFFSSIPDMFAYMVCEALVANSNHNRVIYGPVCQTT